MAEYIEREATKRAFYNMDAGRRGSTLLSPEEFAEYLDEFPAVVVTRCKDCKHLRVWNQKDLYAFCPKTNFVFLPFQADTRTHFCSYGEPKEDTHADNHD